MTAVPTGLAGKYLAGLAVVQYSGRAVLAEQDATGFVRLGNVLNLTGAAQTAWATMNATILEEAVDVDTGTTTLTFGPHPGLKPQEMVELLRVTRPGGMIGPGQRQPRRVGHRPTATRARAARPAARTLWPWA